MIDRPLWFNVCIIAAVFATILLAASAHVGFFTFVLNLLALGMIVAPMVIAVRNGDLESNSTS